MKRVASLVVLGVLAVGCSGKDGSSSDNAASTSSTSSGGGSSSSSGGQSGSHANGSSNNGSSSHGGSSGTSGTVMVGTPAEACANAPTLMPGDNTGNSAGRKNGLSCDDGSVAGDDGAEQVWSLNLPAASGVRITVTSTAVDTVVYLRSGADCATAMLNDDVGCVDSAGAMGTENIQAPLLPAGQYWLVVDGYSAAAMGAFTIHLEVVAGGICVADPAEGTGGNENLADAAPLTGTLRDDMGVREDADLSICMGDQDWFTFRTHGGDVTVHAAPDTGATGTLTAELQTVTRPATGDPTGVVVAGTTFTNGDLVATALPLGEYAVHIGGTGTPAGSGTPYKFNFLPACEDGFEETQLDVWNNDVETRAAGLPDFLGDIGPIDLELNAMDKLGGTLCPNDVDYWWFQNKFGPAFTITLVGGGGTTVTLLKATVDAMGAITGTNGMQTATIMDSGTGGADKSIAVTGATADENYLLKVEQATGLAAAGKKYVITLAGAPPANDTCAMAQMVTLPAIGAAALMLNGSTAGGVSDTEQTTAMCLGQERSTMTPPPQPDVFYTFTAATAVKLTATTGGDLDSVMMLRKDTCAGMEVACNDDEDGENDMYNSSFEVTLAAGSTYFLVVDSWSRGGAFTLSLSTAAP